MNPTPTNSGCERRMHADRVAKETPKDSIYKPESGSDIFRQVEFSTDKALDEQNKHVHPQFRLLMNELFAKYKPSDHPFFKNLREAPDAVVKNPGFLSQLYLRYQAAMHATRASVWFTPFLDTPRLRQRKAAIIVDDDAVDGEATHHRQCENLFRWFGASPILDESHFGDLSELGPHLHPDTLAFCTKAWELYCKDTGAWSIFEVLSDNWQSALAHSMAPHFGPETIKQQYFDEISTGHIEILHMLETVSLTEDVLHRKPHLTEQTIASAKEMAEWTYKLWDHMNELVIHPEPYLSH